MNTIVKRISIVLTMIIMSIELSNAQDCGLSFFGVSLGQSQYSVEDYFDNNGIKYFEEEFKGRTRLEVTRPQIEGVKFDSAGFTFDNNKLSVAKFLCMPKGGTTTYGTPFYIEFLNYAETLANKFEIVVKKLMSKYGNPTLTTDTSVEWHIGDCIIEVEFVFENEDAGYGCIMANTGFHLKYYYE